MYESQYNKNSLTNKAFNNTHKNNEREDLLEKTGENQVPSGQGRIYSSTSKNPSGFYHKNNYNEDKDNNQAQNTVNPNKNP